MSDLLAIIPATLPKRLHASKDGYAFRSIVPNEAAAVETRISEQRLNLNIVEKTGVVVLPNIKHTREDAEDYAALVAFAVSLLVTEGFVFVSAVAIMTGDKCTDVVPLPVPVHVPRDPVFQSGLSPKGVIEWIQKCERAFTAHPTWLHVTATRYNRYLRASNKLDALLDLCISLESLLDAQTEISFRFSVCLAKISGQRSQKAEDASELLAELYTLRSNIVHGSPKAAKLLNEMASSENALRTCAKISSYFAVGEVYNSNSAGRSAYRD